jgi:K+-sensing histidine kinase KdpD
MKQARNETRRERLCAKQTSRKDRFLAVLSHELRNPLAAMQRHFISFKANNYSEARKRPAFEIIDRPSEVHQRLVDDLLDVNRISEGLIRLKKEQIDLRSPIKGAIDAFLPAIEEKGIKFRFRGADRAVTALADPVRIEQFVSNLLNNALKFTCPALKCCNQRLHRANLPKIQTLPSAEAWTRPSHRPLNWSNWFSIWIHSGMNTLGQEYRCCKMRWPLHYHSYK